MRISAKIFAGTMVLSLGRVFSYGLSFLRNVILARALAQADFGLASVFGMAMTLLEISGRMAYGQQIIQSSDGESERFQATAHALQFAGGTVSAALIVSLSVPLAKLFHVPNVWWALAALATVPLSQGLSHLDVARRQRELDYVPLVLVDLLPQFLITAAAWPLAHWLGDYRVIVWLILAKETSALLVSHVLARRPYQWAWEWGYVRHMLRFGWPLYLNGFVMFGCQQADQVLVGAAFSLSMLASYSLAFSLVNIPFFIFGSVINSLTLPLMSRAQDDPARFRRHYRMCAQVSAVGGTVCLVPLIVGGEQIVTLFYGGKYHGTGEFMALLGAASIVRFLRFAPAVAALAAADTVNQLIQNLWRGASLPLALLVWALGGTPVQIAACALGGEVLGTLASLKRLERRQGVPLRESARVAIYLVATLTAGVGFALTEGVTLGLWWSALACAASMAAAAGLAWIMFPELTAFVIDSARQNLRLGADQPSPTLSRT